MPCDHRKHIENFRKFHFDPQNLIFQEISRNSRLQKMVTRNKTCLQKEVTWNKTRLQKMVTRNKTHLQKVVTRNKPCHKK